jgi:Type III restriction enzyme, res subunit.
VIIEKYLILNKYLLSLFGVSDFRDFQEKLRDVRVDIDSDGRSYFVNVLRSSFKNKISEDTLLRYDENIQSYIRKINWRRKSVSLKYFQYLAVLFTEIVLDNLKNRKKEFLSKLNTFLKDYKEKHDINFISDFTENDLTKLAFWMATGSGKTLVSHINYHQFFNYELFRPDSILFITPNEGLSKQHFEELRKSGIPARLYGESLNSGLKNEKEVLVIEMTKFVEEKKGGGVTVPVDAFEGRNLVFVDEGHKGKKSDEQKWAKLRDRLAENGFVFEYSATFGQILSEKNKETLEEYAKAIVFDYSYKYFYLDGYGKDFSILNATQSNIGEQEFQEIMFIANLLSFYEQLLVYGENMQLAKEYNLEKPLWVFVGTTVTGDEDPDVVKIVEFIKKAITDEDWVKEWTDKVLNGKTNLKDEDDKDVFENRFTYIGKSIDFDDLYKRVFGGKGSFEVYEIKRAQGEFGLKVGENNYFGVINIGDTSGFKKQLEERGIPVKQDVISDSLFDDIKKERSSINILIGSKKFIEGWDTWRISSMGLLNIGKGQGSQIIQLFGRGVRLKGKDMSLKRSGEKGPVQLLETLNIYGIKADYLSKFLKAIRREEVEFETLEIPVKLQYEEKWKGLYILIKDEKKSFEEEEILRLELDNKIQITIDLLPKLSMYSSKEREEIEIRTTRIKAETLSLPKDVIEGLFDWKRIWQEVNEYKILKKYWNLIIEKEVLKNLLLSNIYKIQALPDILDIKTQEDVRKLEDIAISIIKNYIEKFYGKHANRFETKHLRYGSLDKQRKQLLLPFVPENVERYTIQIKKEKQDLIKEIKDLIQDLDKLYKEETKELPRIYFDKHLFLPILIKSKEIDKITPEGLEKSEENFIKGLRNYLKINKEKFKDYEIYLLRNFPKSGTGFQLQWSKFYPDFILWIKSSEKQIITFIEPHGLINSRGLNDEKIRFAGYNSSDSEIITIKKIQEEINKKDKKNVVLEYFLLSPTPYKELIIGESNPHSKEEYESNHVLFLDDSDWPEKLFKSLGIL